MSQKVLLMILDGWGLNPDPEISAIARAQTPFIDSLYTTYPHSTLKTFGGYVGLPDGQMGNSEVGHMNIGAGRVVYQDLAKINLAVQQQTLKDNPTLQKVLNYVRTQNKALHLIGLVSDGGVHSHIEHLKGLLEIAKNQGIEKVYIHAFTDGRDVDPKSGAGYLKDLLETIHRTTGKLATVIGRYYAMDRDNRRERIQQAYELMVRGKGEQTSDVIASLQASYDAGVTDEFIKPLVVTPEAVIQQGDAVINFNFRTDRGRQISQALTQQDFPEFGMKALKIIYATMTRYDDNFKNVEILFDKDNLTKTLGEVIAHHGKKQIRIAETEKYPHVTFFFSGGQEQPFEGEKRILIPSPKVATYDLQPTMGTVEIAQAIIPELESAESDFVCLNFAAPDMVGHTGSMEAAVKAVETVDQATHDIVNSALAKDWKIIIIADHGNAEVMKNADGSPNTAHTTNLVPCILVSNDSSLKIQDGKLADIAPTVLHLMNLPQPAEMDGVNLVK